MQVHCEVVARGSPSHYWDLAAANKEHLHRVMSVQACVWRTFSWVRASGKVAYWACRTDGTTIEGRETLEQLEAEIAEHGRLSAFPFSAGPLDLVAQNMV